MLILMLFGRVPLILESNAIIHGYLAGKLWDGRVAIYLIVRGKQWMIVCIIRIVLTSTVGLTANSLFINLIQSVWAVGLTAYTLLIDLSQPVCAVGLTAYSLLIDLSQSVWAVGLTANSLLYYTNWFIHRTPPITFVQKNIFNFFRGTMTAESKSLPIFLFLSGVLWYNTNLSDI